MAEPDDSKISLKEYLLGLLNADIMRIDERFEVNNQRVDEHFIADNDRINQRFDSQNRALDAALLAVREAGDKADRANEKRFDNVNEWRGTYGELQKAYVTRVEMEAMIAKNKQGDYSMIGAIGVICAILGTAIGYFVHGH